VDVIFELVGGTGGGDDEDDLDDVNGSCRFVVVDVDVLMKWLLSA
jgi:hypothetical protein